MNSYYEKYLKYKNKYFKIKNQIGGNKPATVRVNGEDITLSIPERYFCPISKTLLVEPVKLERYFEKDHIERWLQEHGEPIDTLSYDPAFKGYFEKFILDAYRKEKLVSASQVSEAVDSVVLPKKLPWIKREPPPIPSGISKQQRIAFLREQETHKRIDSEGRTLRIYNDLFYLTSYDPLGGMSKAEEYVSVPQTELDADAKYLTVIIYCYNILGAGGTSETRFGNFLGDKINITEEKKQEDILKLKALARTASDKLDSLKKSYSMYFTPNIVENMRRLFA
jgi:hypothetical protein